MLLHVFGHIDADHGLVVVEQEAGQRAGKLGLADAGRPQEHERADGPVRVLEPGTGTPHGCRNRVHRLGLADDALGQLVFHPEQFVLLALQHLLDRNAGPARDDARDVVWGYGLLHHAAPRVGRVFHGLKPLFEVGYDAIGQLAGAREVALALSLLKLVARGVQRFLDLLGRRELFLLFLPAPGKSARTSLPGRRSPFAAARAGPWRPDRSPS